MTVTSALNDARRLMERCDQLADSSDEPNRLTRAYGTKALVKAQEAVAAWMRAAGMAVRRDGIGNLIGRFEGSLPGARTLLIGGHLDTVRDAGKYDGTLGVLVGLTCVERLNERCQRLPFAIEVVAFADEEGLRFQCTYLGSRLLAGNLDPDLLALTDADGITLAEAIRGFGGDPDALANWVRDTDDLLGYCEVHIEQGPVLEEMDLPVGVVSAIAGQSRIAVEFTGEAGHAGTVPMPLRRDALCAAAEFILAVESMARSEEGLVATVGHISVEPGASNVVPGAVELSLDVRHADDTTREAACRILWGRAREIGAMRQVAAEWRVVQENNAIACDSSLTESLARSVVHAGYAVRRLPSGAGHDAVALAELTPVSMLFVRCAGGVSHHPDESVSVDDVAVAIGVVDQFLTRLAHHHGSRR